MKTDTVKLNIEKYNMLMQIYTALNEGRIVRYDIDHIFGNGGVTLYSMEENRVIRKLESDIRILKLKIRELKNPKEKEESIDDIKRMSIWQFIKWRNK